MKPFDFYKMKIKQIRCAFKKFFFFFQKPFRKGWGDKRYKRFIVFFVPKSMKQLSEELA